MSNTLVTCNADLVSINVEDLVGDFKLEFVSKDGVVALVTAYVESSGKKKDREDSLVLQVEDGMFTGVEGEFIFPIVEEEEESGQQARSLTKNKAL